MKFSRDVTKHILIVSGINTILTAVMLGVFALVGRFSLSVLWGALGGLFLICLNFVLLAVTLNKATESGSRGKVAAAISYTSRMLMMLIGGIVAIVYFKVNPAAIIIPYLFPRISIAVMQMLDARRSPDQGGDADEC